MRQSDFINQSIHLYFRREPIEHQQHRKQ